MAWVLLSDTDLEFLIEPGSVDAGTATVDGASLTFAGASNTPSAPFAYGLWNLTVNGLSADATGSVRVVCTSASISSYTVPGPPYITPTPLEYVFADGPETFDFSREITTDGAGSFSIGMQWPAPGSGTDFSGADMVFVFYIGDDFVTVPAEPDPPADTYQPFIQLRYAKDGASNWSGWRELVAGDTGSFLQPMVARRIGRVRHLVVETMDTSDRPQDVLAASIIIE